MAILITECKIHRPSLSGASTRRSESGHSTYVRQNGNIAISIMPVLSGISDWLETEKAVHTQASESIGARRKTHLPVWHLTNNSPIISEGEARIESLNARLEKGKNSMCNGWRTSFVAWGRNMLTLRKSTFILTASIERYLNGVEEKTRYTLGLLLGQTSGWPILVLVPHWEMITRHTVPSLDAGFSRMGFDLMTPLLQHV